MQKTNIFENETQNYYDILDVKPDASQTEIRQAYLRAKAAYSKDSVALYSLFDEQETRLVLDRIEQAYLVLSNSEKRREYDKLHGLLRGKEQTIPHAPASMYPTSSNHVFSFSKSSDPAYQAAQTVFGEITPEQHQQEHLRPEHAHSTNSSVEHAAHDRVVDNRVSSDNVHTTRANEISIRRSNERLHVEHTDASSSRMELAERSNIRLPEHKDLLASDSELKVSQPRSPARFTDPFEAFTPHHENRIGIIRRMELTKPYELDPTVEEEITQQNQFSGTFLKKIREYKGITLDELSEFTKIKKTYISCIEAEEFESLPAPVYLRGFIVQLAKTLKLPHEKVASSYMEKYKNAAHK